MSNPKDDEERPRPNYLGKPITLEDDGSKEAFARELAKVPTDAELGDKSPQDA